MNRINKKSIVYISGPMTGLPDFNFPAFSATAETLRPLCLSVENPADNGAEPGQTWEYYMRLAIAQLVRCNTIYMLNGWENSRGAVVEKQLAKTLGMTIVYEQGAL